MDIATILGIAAVFILIITSIMTQGSVKQFYDFPSILIVVGGSFGALFVCYPFAKIKELFIIMRKAFRGNSYDIPTTIDKFTEMSYIAKKEGLLALEDTLDDVNDEFLKQGIMLLIDGTNPEMIKKILTLEIENMQDRHQEGENILRNLGKYAPAFGMIGTLIGLIVMLNNLEDVSTLGPAMSVALVTTFYGALLANGIFIPLADKLRFYSDKETIYKTIVIEGIVSIVEGDSNHMIREKLETFMGQKERGKGKRSDR